jgi:uncharacterized protein (DUF2237 family)
MAQPAKNVLGGELIPCSYKPLTGFYRDGCCNTGPEDHGCHTVCCVVTGPFLEFSKSRGNDLTTPMPQYLFPGLKPGDKWCVCAGRWVEALQAGMACPVVLEATHERMLDWVSREILEEYAYRGPEPDVTAGWPPEPGNN